MRKLAFLVFLLVFLSAFQIRSSINGTKLASNYGGADLGEKINRACADLGGNPGEIQVDRIAGTAISTAVNCSGVGQVIRFINGGTITVNATVTFNQIEGLGFGGVFEIGHPAVIFKQGNGRNLSSMLTLANDASALRNIEIDGNKSNNPSAGSAVNISKAGNLLENLFIHDSKSHGFWVKSTTTSNNSAAVAQVRHVVSISNDGDGGRIEDALDAYVSLFSEFEMNGGHGLSLMDAGGARILGNDFAQNQSSALYMKGTTGRLLTRLVMVHGNQFGQNYQEDIRVDGYDGVGLTAYEENIGGNVFWSGTHRTSGVYDAIHLKDTFSNTITGNHLNSFTNLYRYGIAIEDTSVGANFVDAWVGNTFGGMYGSGAYLGKASATVVGPNDDGNLTLPGALNAGSASINAGAITLSGSTVAAGTLSVSTANITFANMSAPNSTGGGYQFGGTTSSFPKLVRAGADLQLQLADGSATANFISRSVRGTPVTVANLPASPSEGMLVPVTDSNTNTWGATIAGGGSNHVLGYYNGTNWTVAGK